MPGSREVNSQDRPAQAKGIKVYYWKYDDNTWGLAVRDKSQTHEKQLFDHGVFASKSELQTNIASLQKEAEENGKRFCKKRLRIPTGLDYVEKSTIPAWDSNEAAESREELESFLNSCGTDDAPRKEVLRLFSGILTGYCARLAKPSLEKTKSTPVMDDAPLIAVGYEDNVFDFLFRAHLALAIDPDFPPAQPLGFGGSLRQCGKEAVR